MFERKLFFYVPITYLQTNASVPFIIFKKNDLLNVLALKMKTGWERKVVCANRYTKPISPLKITQNLNLWGSPQSYTVVLWLRRAWYVVSQWNGITPISTHSLTTGHLAKEYRHKPTSLDNRARSFYIPPQQWQV